MKVKGKPELADSVNKANKVDLCYSNYLQIIKERTVKIIKEIKIAFFTSVIIPFRCFDDLIQFNWLKNRNDLYFQCFEIYRTFFCLDGILARSSEWKLRRNC